MSLWLFSSRDIDNIKTAKERLLWGFWDRDASEKTRKNWRSFIRLYNRIKPLDLVIFQTVGGEIHALGGVQTTYYDDQTPVWPEEIKQDRVLFPWKVQFHFILFFEEPITKKFIRISNYLDGYGLGEIEEHEFRNIISKINAILKNSNANFEIRVNKI